MSNFKVYTQEDIAGNDEFFEMRKEHLSSRDLSVVQEKSPAHWAFPDPDKEQTTAQELGIASHLIILDKPAFDAKYVRGLDPKDYPGALMSDAAMKSFLKAKGVGGYSNKKTTQLIEMVKQTGESVICFAEVEAEFVAKNNGLDIIKAKDFDRMDMMRKSIFANGEYAERLTGGFCKITIMGELEVDGELYNVVINPDLITSSGGIWDYVTTTSAHPDDFGRNCINYNRLMKAALEYDVFTQHYGQQPSESVLLCQEKEYPYVPQAYALTQAQLEYGRERYQAALKTIHSCKKSGIYPAYGNGIIRLETPAWAGIEE